MELQEHVLIFNHFNFRFLRLTFKSYVTCNVTFVHVDVTSRVWILSQTQSTGCPNCPIHAHTPHTSQRLYVTFWTMRCLCILALSQQKRLQAQSDERVANKAVMTFNLWLWCDRRYTSSTACWYQLPKFFRLEMISIDGSSNDLPLKLYRLMR